MSLLDRRKMREKKKMKEEKRRGKKQRREEGNGCIIRTQDTLRVKSE